MVCENCATEKARAERAEEDVRRSNERVTVCSDTFAASVALLLGNRQDLEAALETADTMAKQAEARIEELLSRLMETPPCL